MVVRFERVVVGRCTELGVLLGSFCSRQVCLCECTCAVRIPL
jgi:hypothetical protein